MKKLFLSAAFVALAAFPANAGSTLAIGGGLSASTANTISGAATHGLAGAAADASREATERGGYRHARTLGGGDAGGTRRGPSEAVSGCAGDGVSGGGREAAADREGGPGLRRSHAQ